MPRFTEKEREIIDNKLRTAGENLFSTHGLKKVTVDDLVVVANISKGSFYAFYQSKESLFLDINFELQTKLFTDIKEAIRKMKSTNLKEVAVQALFLTIKGFYDNSILSQLDREMLDYLKRKLPQKIFEQHTYSDNMILEELENIGVCFSYPFSVIIKSVHAIMACTSELKDDPERDDVVKILLHGMITQIVKTV